MNARWAIFLSGRGSTAQAVMDLADAVDVRLAVSSNPQAAGLKRARRMGVATLAAPVVAGSKKIDWEKLQSELERRRINRIFLLGFMRIIPGSFLRKWEGRIFNLHPSLLPSFAGANAIENSFASHEPMGVSVHHVIEEMDAGKVIHRKRIRLLDPVPRAQETWERARFLVGVHEQRLVRKLALRASLSGGAL